MTPKMLEAILKTAEAETDKGGTSALPEKRSLTFYCAHAGVALAVSRIVSLRVEDGLVKAQDHKGELYVFALEDAYAASVSGAAPPPTARKAGFLAG
ncbi:MAG: hypothetical protein IT373_16555 [Polyangiaceae bacterium]|nr:hypothetical protein [Polyangiaceae bacterium]